MIVSGGADVARTDLAPRILEVLQQYWGFDALRPLQEQAIAAGLEQRDSLVVLPTGGGKSLCYQVPPLLAERLDVVVSPLISLMKDQVDGLRACGYPAAALHSGQDAGERRRVNELLHGGGCRLLFVSPERLLGPGFADLLRELRVESFVIDEAHCISHWGHDFRPEYRQLASLRDRFRNASIHAFTATATPRVQQDIVEQLGLRDPAVLVGVFDRPNLVYRILPRTGVQGQVLNVLRRHEDEAAIVYCISRKDTETLAEHLKGAGVRAAPYHAGLPPQQRARTQEAFSQERLDVVVATVAFGMGIDRSNVRCVIHAAMPKSIEHYQQETGRAGRDGLEAECVLFYSARDPITWRALLERAQEGAEQDPETAAAATAAQLELLAHMQGLCSSLECRHHALSRYFGQRYLHERCGACDVCLDEVQPMDGSTVVAQKILSCIARLGQRFGVGYTVQVLRGAATEAIRARGHDGLSTWGLLGEMPEPTITNLLYQLVDQGLLERSAGDRPVLRLNADSMTVLRGERAVRLRDPGPMRVRRSRSEAESWEGVDRDLFERLRSLRRAIAAERDVPPYVIFGDATLRDLARQRPKTLEAMTTVHGIGSKRLADFGAIFLEEIVGTREGS